MANDQHIRVGIVGAGGNTKARHIPGLQKIDGVEIVVVCNRSEESSRQVADEFGIDRIADHWTDVVGADDVDAVVIGTWPYLHAEVTIAALDAQKHVMTEARMARDAAEAQRMLAKSQMHPELVTQVVPAPMTLDVDPFAQELVRSGKLGELREVCVTSTNGKYADPETPYSWRQDYDYSGHNILSLGIWHETVLRWLDEDPLWVMADAQIFINERYDPETETNVEVRIPDSLSVLGRLKFGGRLVYHFSGVEPGTGRNELELNGSEACLRWRGGKLYLAEVGEKQERELEVPEDKRRGWRVEEDFIHAIRTGDPVPLTRFETGLRYMNLIDAVWQSWEDGGVKVHL